MGKTDKMREVADKYSQAIEGYKQYAEARRASRTYTQENLTELYERMKGYLRECRETETPMTVGGLCLAMGIDRMALHRMKTGFYDWRLFEYIDITGVQEKDIQSEEDEYFKGFSSLQYCIDTQGNKVLLMMYSEVVSVGLAQIEAENEAGLFSSKPVGRIFYLKSVFGYNDNPETRTIDTAEQRFLENISTEQARRALEMLGMHDEE